MNKSRFVLSLAIFILMISCGRLRNGEESSLMEDADRALGVYTSGGAYVGKFVQIEDFMLIVKVNNGPMVKFTTIANTGKYKLINFDNNNPNGACYFASSDCTGQCYIHEIDNRFVRFNTLILGSDDYYLYKGEGVVGVTLQSSKYRGSEVCEQEIWTGNVHILKKWTPPKGINFESTELHIR